MGIDCGAVEHGVRLISWNRDLVREHARELEKAGFSVEASPPPTSRLVAHFKNLAPQAILIDLDRLPSHGHVYGVVLRRAAGTRHIPIVFAGGAAEKVERIRHQLPDAFFTDWKNVARELRKAMKNAPTNPIRPIAYMEQWAGSSLVKKLGIKPQMKVAIVGAPEGFEETLGDLPEGLEILTRLTLKTKLAIWFVRSLDELSAATDYISARMPEGGSVWIAHPKATGRYRVDFNQRDVRAVALAAGLVDYKVCSVDADWSACKFTRAVQNKNFNPN